MSKPWTEEKVLNKLNIPDFRHLTKENVISLASMLDKMDPEVAQKALEQFPSFAGNLKEIALSYKDFLEKLLLENEKNVATYYDSCISTISTLQNELENNNLDFDQKRFILECILDVNNRMSIKDTENKSFKFKLAGMATTASIILVAIMANALGGNTKIELPKLSK